MKLFFNKHVHLQASHANWRSIVHMIPMQSQSQRNGTVCISSLGVRLTCVERVGEVEKVLDAYFQVWTENKPCQIITMFFTKGFPGATPAAMKLNVQDESTS
jgi:hypothetical protein